MTQPQRIQLRRTKGWKMPENTVKVDRSTRWGNPFRWEEWKDDAPRDVLWYPPEIKAWCQERAVEAFAEDLQDGRIVLDLAPLRGKNLACWCDKHHRCHADVLLELANPSPTPIAREDLGK